MKNLSNKLLDRFPALKYKNFRYFLAGQCISITGTWMQKTAQQWVVYSITKSAFLLGVVGVFQFTPMLLISLFAGVFVDQFPKKKILLITQLSQMLQALTLSLLIWTGHIQYWHILLMAAFYGLIFAFDMPTRQSFFIELVGKEGLISAIGLNSTVANIAKIAGPAIAGIIIVKYGSAFCFFFNGISFIAVIVGLLKIKYSTNNIRKKNCNIFQDIINGLKYVKSKKVILNSMILMVFVGVFAMNIDIIIPVFVNDVLKEKANVYSFLLSAVGIGSLVGSLLFASKEQKKSNLKMIFISSILLSVFLIFVGLSNNYYVVLTMLTLFGFFNIIFMISVNSIIQLNSNNEFRGRVMSVYSMVLVGSTPIGNFITGIVTENSGSNVSFIFCGGITLLFLVIFFIKFKINSNKVINLKL